MVLHFVVLAWYIYMHHHTWVVLRALQENTTACIVRISFIY